MYDEIDEQLQDYYDGYMQLRDEHIHPNDIKVTLSPSFHNKLCAISLEGKTIDNKTDVLNLLAEPFEIDHDQENDFIIHVLFTLH